MQTPPANDGAGRLCGYHKPTHVPTLHTSKKAHLCRLGPGGSPFHDQAAAANSKQTSQASWRRISWGSMINFCSHQDIGGSRSSTHMSYVFLMVSSHAVCGDQPA
mmetsp:Transcript_38225/g.85157  ORF Transcript_38225/g.85157 Transcript_38225/m.85157 type:complete len:105 (-) Transcript_38225:166-480(-)